MLKRLAIGLLSLFFFLTPTAALPSEEIDALFEDCAGGPGGAVGVVTNDRLVFAKGYGYADVAKKTPNTPDTNYDLASVSKQFTATALLVQAQEGKLSVNDPLGDYISGLPEYAASVPLKHLLNMTSGLPDYDYEASVARPSLVEQLNDEDPSFDPGDEYEYLNMNYVLLTYVVEEVTKQKLGRVMEQSIFKPLGMKQTVFLSVPGQRIPNRAKGYVETEDGWEESRDDAPGVGDGNVFSNVNDLSLWARDLLNGSSVLDRKRQRQAWTSGIATDGGKTEYGFGFMVEESDGYTRISHSGSWSGTSTYISFYPEEELAVIVLSNREDEDTSSLGERVEELFLP
jgi:CubicO group peptidase (beta-lactamase class C family)